MLINYHDSNYGSLTLYCFQSNRMFHPCISKRRTRLQENKFGYYCKNCSLLQLSKTYGWLQSIHRHLDECNLCGYFLDSKFVSIKSVESLTLNPFYVLILNPVVAQNRSPSPFEIPLVRVFSFHLAMQLFLGRIRRRRDIISETFVFQPKRWTLSSSESYSWVLWKKESLISFEGRQTGRTKLENSKGESRWIKATSFFVSTQVIVRSKFGCILMCDALNSKDTFQQYNFISILLTDFNLPCVFVA